MEENTTQGSDGDSARDNSTDAQNAGQQQSAVDGDFGAGSGAAFSDATSTANQPSESEGDGNGEKPDPSEVDSIDTSQHVYQRDEDGNLLPETDVVNINGEWHRVEHIPPTRGFLGKIQKQFGGREDIELDEIDNIMSDFYDDPDMHPDEWTDASGPFYMSLMWHMIETVMGDSDDELMSEMQEAVEERQQAQAGN